MATRRWAWRHRLQTQVAQQEGILELRVDIAKVELHLAARVPPLRRQIIRPIREDLHQRALERNRHPPPPCRCRCGRIDKNLTKTSTFVKLDPDQNVNFSCSSCQDSPRRLNCAPCVGTTGSSGPSISVKLPWMAYFDRAVYGEPDAPNECYGNSGPAVIRLSDN
jgi:hypothetical protein